MAESRWQRWSRKKTEARYEVEPTPPSTVEPVEPEPAPEEQELAVNEALPEHEVLEKYSLPDPDAIELGTDITGFMRKEIPELLRRKALRSLWKSNPVLAVLDGLNDYDEDFTDFAPGVKGAKTLYKVGKGFIDRTARATEEPGKPAGEGIREQVEEESANESQKQVNAPIAEKQSAENPSEPDVATGDTETRTQLSEHTESVSAETEGEPAPSYRPRMRFD